MATRVLTAIGIGLTGGGAFVFFILSIKAMRDLFLDVCMKRLNDAKTRTHSQRVVRFIEDHPLKYTLALCVFDLIAIVFWLAGAYVLVLVAATILSRV